MKLYLEVVADTNDADYVTSRNEITREEIEQLKPLIKAIALQKGHNWDTSEYARDSDRPTRMYPEFISYKEGYGPDDEDDYEARDWQNDIINLFGEYVPYGEYGIHTIKSITVMEVQSEVDLLEELKPERKIKKVT